MGWFGFNAGSTTASNPSITLIAMNTFVSASAGAVAAMATTWIRSGKPDAPMTLNGDLVGITAGCANLAPGSAILTGVVAGVLIVYASLWLERRVDDPVGAIAVHGVCGAWGTLAAGLFDTAGFSLGTVGVQVVGIVAAFLWVSPLAFGLFTLIDRFVGLRVEAQPEALGLDLHEHATQAYPEFGAGNGGDGFVDVPSDEFIPAEV